jgi:predicted enzyme related to lactoylglutathione lyase
VAGNLNYFEIPAKDAGRAKSFWSSLFGWEFRDQPATVPYSMAQSDDLGVGLYESEDRGLWAYFYVDDLESAVAQVQELGGKVRDKGPVAGVGWYARCEDTEGNKFGLFQTDEAAG